MSREPGASKTLKREVSGLGGDVKGFPFHLGRPPVEPSSASSSSLPRNTWLRLQSQCALWWVLKGYSAAKAWRCEPQGNLVRLLLWRPGR